MRRPKERGSVSQFAGNKYVGIGSRNEPGACGLMKPSMKTINTTKVGIVSTRYLQNFGGRRLTAKA